MCSRQILSACALSAALCLSAAARAAAPDAAATLIESDYVIHDFHFASGEALPELRLHYAILGTPRRDSHGRISHAVLILHGIGGSARSPLNEQFAGVLFGKRQVFDSNRRFILFTPANRPRTSRQPP